MKPDGSIPPPCSRNKAHEALRGIAILLIIIFHANKGLLPYGYHGVDIFLVLSGYYIYQSFQRSATSPGNYIRKRLGRIYPPLVGSIMLTLLLLTLLTSQDTLVPSAKTAIAALFGVSNVYLAAQEGGYFASSTMSNALLHTWYISLTLQLYLIFAAGWYLSSKVRKTWLIAATVLVGVLSFGWANQVLVYVILNKLNLAPAIVSVQTPDEMYYELFPRLWVVLAGLGAALLPEIRKTSLATLLGLSGLALMLGPALMHTETSRILAASVVAGSVLSIRYLTTSRLVAGLVQNKSMVWIGQISFSLYLVHLPIVAIYRSLNGLEELPITDLALVVPIILLSGWAFNRGVECRKIGWKPALTGMGICLLVSTAAFATQGFREYIHKQANSIRHTTYTGFGASKDATLLSDYPEKELTYWDGVYRFTGQAVPKLDTSLLHIGASDKPANFILLGDCQAHTLYAGLHESCRREGLSGVFAATYMLAFWDRLCNESDNRDYNREKAEAMLNWLAKHPEIKHVIIAQLWSYWMPPETRLKKKWDGSLHPSNTLETATQDLMHLCRKLQSIGKKVILLNEVPTIASHAPLSAIRGQLCVSNTINPTTLQQNSEEYANINKPYRQCLEKVKDAGLCTLLHAAEIHLEDGLFSAWENGQVLMYDNMHQTYPAALITAKGLMPQLKDILKP